MCRNEFQHTSQGCDPVFGPPRFISFHKMVQIVCIDRPRLITYVLVISEGISSVVSHSENSRLHTHMALIRAYTILDMIHIV